jgi:hypothetical protein
MIDATMVEVVLYVRDETLIYSNEDEFQKQLIVQANAISDSIAELDAVIRQNCKFFELANPPENVPGQVLAIAEVIVDKVEQFDPSKADNLDDFFRSLPVLSRQDLMERLRAYRDYIHGAAGMERAEPGNPGFTTDPLTPWWW